MSLLNFSWNISTKKPRDVIKEKLPNIAGEIMKKPKEDQRITPPDTSFRAELGGPFETNVELGVGEKLEERLGKQKKESRDSIVL